jgi:hypothetical protein
LKEFSSTARPPRAGAFDNDIAKLSPDGDVLWTRQVNGFEGTADAHGNLYVTRPPTGELDKYGAAGEHLWTLPITNGAPGNFWSIDVDDVGNIFVSGSTYSIQGPVLDVEDDVISRCSPARLLSQLLTDAAIAKRS